MPEKIYIGNLSSKGLQKFLLPFNIDNEAFATMYNFYSWRGRVKKKRGTVGVGRLQRQIQISASPNNYQVQSFALVGGAGDLVSQFNLGSTANIVPLSLSLVVSGDQTYTDPNGDGTLTGSSGGTGTINYSTGAFTVSGSLTGTVTGNFSYYPDLPVLGLEDYITTSTQYPLLLAFDQKYAYQIDNMSHFYSVSYYKGSNIPVTWNGANYQQFWTTNYQGALWATNNNGGLIFELIATITVGNPTIITVATAHGLKTGDYVFFNEITGANANLLNLQTAQITRTSPTAFTIPINTTGMTINNNGMFQILTDNPNVTANTGATKDGIKWYDGDMTGATGIPITTATGWVNFAPPLTAGTVTIDDNGPLLYYLVGATAVVPFKDRLVFMSPWIQASTGAAVQLPDVALWSWNGTPYYSSLRPTGQNYDVTAYYVDQTGKGGWLSAGIDQYITTVGNNEDVLLVGFTQKQTRFVYTGNDLFPFLFYIINSELGSASTFSGIILDRGLLAFGLNGLTITTQVSCERIDIAIPDQVFQIKGPANVFAAQRISAARDFYHEWVYFTFVPNDSAWSFPTQTLQYNYRENAWSFNYENFTAHGQYRKQQGYTWASIPFRTWNTWRESWSSATTTALFPSVVAGNPQGFVVIKGQGTGEAPTGYISAISNASGFVQITSYNHCVAINDYLYFSKGLGTMTSAITGISQTNPAVITTTNTFSVGQVIFISQVVGMTQMNMQYVTILAASSSSLTVNVDATSYTPYVSGGLLTISPLGFQIGQVETIIDANNFTTDIRYVNLGYIGKGLFTRLILPLLQTKQFAPYWNEGRQVRIGAQKYLLDNTSTGQATVNIYLNQDPDTAFNYGPIVPSDEALNDSLEYSQILYTCPESTNIGLTPITSNLQSPVFQVSTNQYQMWHRINTSLQGESFQIGITLSDAQMRNLNYATSEITLHAAQFDVSKGPIVS